MNRERYAQEALRLAAILRDEIRNQGVSIRSLEHRMEVGNSIYQKVLGGKTTMTLGHLLQLADALGLDWPSFFRRAYPGSPQLPEASLLEEDDFDRKVMDVLRRHGLVPDFEAGK